MKFAPLLAALAIGSLVAACNSLDSPFSGLASNPLLNTGRDARVYNGNTGQYEWPNTTPTPRPKKTPVAVAANVTPPPLATPARGKTPSPKTKATPNAVVAKATPTPAPPPPQATPNVVAQITPVPAPVKGTGIYNVQTHRFEWATPGVAAPGNQVATPAKKTPAPSKKRTPAPSTPAQ